MPDVLVSSWQTSAAEAGSDPIGPFFAYDASFRGGVDVAASGTGDGLWKESFLGTTSWAPPSAGAPKQARQKRRDP